MTIVFILVKKHYLCIMMTNIFPQTSWATNVILADADYVDSVAFNLICNFERMLGRRIPQADFARWADCVALDGGLRPVEDNGASLPAVQVVLLHGHERQAMDNFTPGHYEQELDGKAFSDHIGEFLISACTSKGFVPPADFFAEALEAVCAAPEVKRLMVIPNAEDAALYSRLCETLRRSDRDDRRVTLFAMQPMPGGAFRQEILGYSLMAALGISASEIKG
jgi:hypothetical protein